MSPLAEAATLPAVGAHTPVHHGEMRGAGYRYLVYIFGFVGSDIKQQVVVQFADWDAGVAAFRLNGYGSFRVRL